MISPNLIWGLSLGLLIISFLGIIAFGYISNRKTKNEFSFLSHFPFEYIHSYVPNVFLYLYIAGAFSPLLVCIPLFSDFGDMAIFNIFIACLFGLTSLGVVCLFKIGTNYIRPHIKLATGVIVASLLLCGVSAVHAFVTYSSQARFGGGVAHIILGSLAALLAILMLVVAFNPKLKDWANLEEVINGEEKSYIRPKFLSLAYSEWIAIAVTFISEIIFLLSLLNI